jgi:hypothetical protein
MRCSAICCKSTDGQQFALSPARTPFAVRTTRCWPVWFVRVARPTERNAQPPARRQPACVSVGNVKPNLGALACSLRQRSRFRKIGLYLLPSPAFREVSHRGLARCCVTMYYKASHLKGERSNGKPSDGNPERQMPVHVEAAYKDAVDNIIVLKRQQWVATNYALLVYAAIFVISAEYFSRTDFARTRSV